MKRPSLRHRAEHLTFLAARWGVRRLPERAALRLGSLLGWFAGSVLRVRRSVVEGNLRRAFPDELPAWRRRIAAKSYRHFGREAVTLLRLEALGPEGLRGRCSLEGAELLEDALGEGRGVILLTGHLGNWEVGGAATAARGLSLDVVAREQANPLFERALGSARERLGMRVVFRHEGPRPLLRALREPRVVALVADQNVSSGGVFVEFFGSPAATARGPALLASRTGAAVVLAAALRVPGPTARYRVRYEPLRFEPSGDPDTDVPHFTRCYLAFLEEAIREAPEQYFWHHRRWKTRPAPEEPPSPRAVGESAG